MARSGAGLLGAEMPVVGALKTTIQTGESGELQKKRRSDHLRSFRSTVRGQGRRGSCSSLAYALCVLNSALR